MCGVRNVFCAFAVFALFSFGFGVVVVVWQKERGEAKRWIWKKIRNVVVVFIRQTRIKSRANLRFYIFSNVHASECLAKYLDLRWLQPSQPSKCRFWEALIRNIAGTRSFWDSLRSTEIESLSKFEKRNVQRFAQSHCDNNIFCLHLRNGLRLLSVA